MLHMYFKPCYQVADTSNYVANLGCKRTTKYINEYNNNWTITQCILDVLDVTENKSGKTEFWLKSKDVNY